MSTFKRLDHKGSIHEFRHKAFFLNTRGISHLLAALPRGKITLMPEQSPAEDFSTLAHEVAHLCSHGIYVME